jgi:thiamine-phosphate pyrophosphorylase
MRAPAAASPLFAAPVVYPIVDTEVCAARGLDPLRLAEACLRGGARVLQLRCKARGSGAWLALARETVALAAPYGTRIIVNDRADMAALAGAAGVHVGQEDLAVDDVRRVAGATIVVGLSTHTRTQIDRALETSATYVAVGPIFATGTKATGYGPRGLELVRYARGRGKPIVAIGGITVERAAELVAAGVSGLAVITDLLVTGDAERRVREYIAAIG